MIKEFIINNVYSWWFSDHASQLLLPSYVIHVTGQKSILFTCSLLKDNFQELEKEV